MITVDDFYKEVRECDYKGEHYLVRDNGAVLRHPRAGKRIRKYDNVWTFGKPGNKNYCYISSESVHRIVAFAFHGVPPTPQHIVDHIDTNHRNNRPENLRWVTQLENTLNNEITRAKVILVCGSVEAYLENPSLLWGHESMDPNFSWMRTVSPDEARISKERLLQWARERPNPKGGSIGEWIFEDTRIERNQYTKATTSPLISSERPSISAEDIQIISQSVDFPNQQERIEFSNEFPSLTPNVVQVNWRTPTEFPLCPQEQVESPLVDYMSHLTKDSVFCHNQYQDSLVLDAALDENKLVLYVICKSSDDGAIKPWSMAKVTFKDGVFYHESLGTFFQEDGAQKSFILAQGKKWTGGEVIEDFC